MKSEMNPVITGAGWVTPFGTDLESITSLVHSDAVSKDLLVLPELDFHSITGVKNKRTKKMDTLSKMASIAAHLAFESASLNNEAILPGRGSVVSGSAFGASLSIDTFNKTLMTQGPEFVNPNIFPSTSHNVAGGHISIQFGFSGPLIHFASGVISSHLALIYGADIIDNGRADIILCGGWEQLSPELSQVLEKSGMKPSVPMACMFTIESADHASKRNITPLASIITKGSAIVKNESLNKSSAPAPSPLEDYAYGASGALSLLALLKDNRAFGTFTIERETREGDYAGFVVEKEEAYS